MERGIVCGRKLFMHLYMHSPPITYYCSVRAPPQSKQATGVRAGTEKEIYQNSLDRECNLHAIEHWQR